MKYALANWKTLPRDNPQQASGMDMLACSLADENQYLARLAVNWTSRRAVGGLLARAATNYKTIQQLRQQKTIPASTSIGDVARMINSVRPYSESKLLALGAASRAGCALSDIQERLEHISNNQNT